MVRLDGEEWDGSVLSPGAAEDLRVCVTLDGTPLIDLPFSEAHAIDILLPDGGEGALGVRSGAAAGKTTSSITSPAVRRAVASSRRATAK